MPFNCSYSVLRNNSETLWRGECFPPRKGSGMQNSQLESLICIQLKKYSQNTSKAFFGIVLSEIHLNADP